MLRASPALKEGIHRLQQKVARYRHPSFDVYFEPNFIPLDEIRADRCVATVHDFSFLHHPEWHPEERVRYFERHFHRNIRRADVVLVDSAFVKQEALRHLALPQERIVVVPGGHDPGLFRPQRPEAVRAVSLKYDLRHPYFLYVGTVEPRKNLDRVLRVFERFAARAGRPVRFVVCGTRGWSNRALFREFERLEQMGLLRYLGHVPDADLPPLYSGALSLVYCSLYEGFGLPVVEAMASGCPVLCSGRSALPEVAGDAPLYVDPEDSDAILMGMARLHEDGAARASMVERGLARAAGLTWDASARSVLERLTPSGGDSP